jgi:hypothetical protein
MSVAKDKPRIQLSDAMNFSGSSVSGTFEKVIEAYMRPFRLRSSRLMRLSRSGRNTWHRTPGSLSSSRGKRYGLAIRRERARASAAASDGSCLTSVDAGLMIPGPPHSFRKPD